MKRFLALALLSGCTIGEGTTDGTVIDSHWGGIIFNTCAVDVQYGKGSSKVEMYTTRDKALCDALADKVGKEVKIKYENVLAHAWIMLDSQYVIKSFE